MADINPPGALSGVAQPNWVMKVNGDTIARVESVRVSSNNYYRADEWSAELIPDGEAKWTLDKWFPQNDTSTPPMVEIGGGDNLMGDYTTWIIGRADKRSWNPLTGVLSVSGRDRTAELIEAKTFENFKNKTSSDIATILAGRHGMTPVVTTTTTAVSRYYQQDHDKVTGDTNSRAMTEWDLLTELAQDEGFDVFVYGNELHFQPQPVATGDAWCARIDRSVTPVRANFTGLTVAKDDLTKSILVRVRSWNSKMGSGFEVTAPIGVSQSQAQSGKTTAYEFRRPNLTRDQAQKVANGLYKNLSRHQVKVTAEWPNMTSMTARSLLRLDGVSVGMDGVYFITTIDRDASFSDGYSEHVTACNQQPSATAAVA